MKFKLIILITFLLFITFSYASDVNYLNYGWNGSNWIPIAVDLLGQLKLNMTLNLNSSGGGSSQPEINQNVNTTANVTFNSLMTGNINLTGNATIGDLEMGTYVFPDTDPIFGTAEVARIKQSGLGNYLVAETNGGFIVMSDATVAQTNFVLYNQLYGTFANFYYDGANLHFSSPVKFDSTIQTNGALGDGDGVDAVDTNLRMLSNANGSTVARWYGFSPATNVNNNRSGIAFPRGIWSGDTYMDGSGYLNIGNLSISPSNQILYSGTSEKPVLNWSESKMMRINSNLTISGNLTTNGSLIFSDTIAKIYSQAAGKNILAFDNSLPALSIGSSVLPIRSYTTSVGNVVSNSGYASTAVGHGVSIVYACKYSTAMGFQAGCTAGEENFAIGSETIVGANLAGEIGIHDTNNDPNTIRFGIYNLQFMKLTNTTISGVNVNATGNISAKIVFANDANITRSLNTTTINAKGNIKTLASIGINAVTPPSQCAHLADLVEANTLEDVKTAVNNILACEESYGFRATS